MDEIKDPSGENTWQTVRKQLARTEQVFRRVTSAGTAGGRGGSGATAGARADAVRQDGAVRWRGESLREAAGGEWPVRSREALK